MVERGSPGSRLWSFSNRNASPLTGQESFPGRLLSRAAVTPQVRQLRVLQPYVLSCCYSLDADVVTETFAVLKRLTELLSWQQCSSFFVQLSFTLGPFFEEVKPFAGSFPFSGRPKELGRITRKGRRHLNVGPFWKALLEYVLLGNGYERQEMY